MELSLGLHEEILSKRCDDCGHFCSVGPIWNVSRDGSKFTCGRCAIFTRPFKARNLLFEKMARHFSFPCIYEGCQEVLPWGEQVGRHEVVCPHRTTKCPLSLDCRKVFPIRDLEQHVYQFHLHQLSRNAMPVDLVQGGYRVVLVECDKKLFIVVIGALFSPEVRVASVEDLAGAYKFNVCLYSTQGSPVWLLGKDEAVRQFDGEDHCLDCLTTHCDQMHRYHKRGRFVSIPATAIRTVFGNGSDSLEMRVRIAKRVDGAPRAAAAGGVKLGNRALAKMKSLDVLKRNLVCPGCKGYMTGRIYNCVLGLVMCGECRLGKSSGRLVGARNFPIEGLVEAVFGGAL